MRKIILLILLGVLCFPNISVGGGEIEMVPYIKGGTVAWDQLSGKGGHKSMIAGGLNVNLRINSFGTGIELEKWQIAEELDDDKGIIPDGGYSLSLAGKYYLKKENDFQFYPYARVGFEKWQREESIESWKSLKFFNWGIGLGLESEKGYLRGALLKVFSANTSNGERPSGRYGVLAETGLKWQSLIVGLFYKYLGLEDPDAKMVQSGILIGYIF